MSESVDYNLQIVLIYHTTRMKILLLIEFKKMKKNIKYCIIKNTCIVLY